MEQNENSKKIIESCRDIVLPGSNGVMPIAGYFGPHRPFVTATGNTTPDYLEDKYYQMIEDAGFNLICYTEYVYEQNHREYHDALALAEKHDIGMFVIDSRIKHGMTDGEISDCIADYSKYKSFAGLYIADEPSTNNFPQKLEGFDQQLGRRLMSWYAKNSKLVNSYDNMLGYVNLLPIYHWMDATTEDYEDYIKEYCETFGAKILSYDHYPFCVYYEGGMPETAMKYYFLNFSIIYKYAKMYHLDLWAFIQAGGNWASTFKEVEIYEPNREETLWLVNISLAYGAKGIQYFPLIQVYDMSLRPDGTVDSNRSGIIGADCKPTRYWHFAKEANAQIKVVDEILLECESKGLIAVGEVAKYTEGLPEFFAEASYRELQSVKTEKEGAVIGCLDYHGKTVLYVVNHDREKDQNIKLQFDDMYTYHLLAAGCDEQQTGTVCEVSLGAGAAVLILIGDH